MSYVWGGAIEGRAHETTCDLGLWCRRLVGPTMVRYQQWRYRLTVKQSADVRVPDDKPPAWANSLMKWVITTPGLQKMVGGVLALLSFRGRRTGKLYTIPVSYYRDDGLVTIITKRQHKWWHNFENPMEVGLRLAGRTCTGKAIIQIDDAANLDFMTKFLQNRPVDAKAYGLARDELTREKIARIIPHIVVIEVTIEPEGRPAFDRS